MHEATHELGTKLHLRGYDEPRESSDRRVQEPELQRRGGLREKALVTFRDFLICLGFSVLKGQGIFSQEVNLKYN